jgi:hypothetical protein
MSDDPKRVIFNFVADEVTVSPEVAMKVSKTNVTWDEAAFRHLLEDQLKTVPFWDSFGRPDTRTPEEKAKDAQTARLKAARQRRLDDRALKAATGLTRGQAEKLADTLYEHGIYRGGNDW